jgi:hypothetical protein
MVSVATPPRLEETRLDDRGTNRTTVSSGHKRPRRHIGIYVFLPPAILALSLIANGAIQSRSRGNATAVAEKALAKAIKKVPFQVRLPKTLPGNAVMVRVFLDEPDSDQGFQAFQLNVWYRTLDATATGGGESMHVWQTNDKFLARRLADPMQLKGIPLTIGGQSWRQVTDDRVSSQVVTTFSHRFDNGITMTVDSKNPELAKLIIEKLDIVPVS